MLFVLPSAECTQAYEGLCFALQHNELQVLSHAKEEYYAFMNCASHWWEHHGEEGAPASVESMLLQILSYLLQQQPTKYLWYQETAALTSFADRGRANRLSEELTRHGISLPKS